MAKGHQNLETPATKPLPRLSIPGDHSPSMDRDIPPFFHHTVHLPEFAFPQSPVSFQYSGVCYNERCYNERMLQRTQMLKQTRRTTIGRHNTCVLMTFRAFPLWLKRLSSPLLSFVRFSCKFGSVMCLFEPLAVNFFKKTIQLYNFSHQPAK